MPTSASDGLDDNESSDDESFEGVVDFEIDELFTSSDIDSDDREYHLPRHQCCACHTLNLIASKDIIDAE